ncbi:LOW QUALITY PROTEIN: hypothetical protein HID58_094735 [Brassica napus]|uniref:Uncharacterized protein n=1 Tax=Brassica napus TaxID=3708 RepID=A0ABQ7X6A7_BRANA|nr:LOW QUALITY PROTEIN: hypothetical protein HID58_094735 [Brassica napus]
MDIFPFSSTLGWHSLKVKSEVQTRKGLRWIPRHPETRKGVSNKSVVLLASGGVCRTLDGESPVAEASTSLCSDPSSIFGHWKSRVNQQGPPFKAKYSFLRSRSST